MVLETVNWIFEQNLCLCLLSCLVNRVIVRIKCMKEEQVLKTIKSHQWWDQYRRRLVLSQDWKWIQLLCDFSHVTKINKQNVCAKEGTANWKHKINSDRHTFF